MALFRGIQEYIALDANNFTFVFDSGNIANISGNMFLYPPQGHPILYKYFYVPIDLLKNTDQCICHIKAVNNLREISQNNRGKGHRHKSLDRWFLYTLYPRRCEKQL